MFTARRKIQKDKGAEPSEFEERNNTEYKLEIFSGVYRKLSGRDVVFEYPIIEA